jgi:hypothetical protein
VFHYLASGFFVFPALARRSHSTPAALTTAFLVRSLCREKDPRALLPFTDAKARGAGLKDEDEAEVEGEKDFIDATGLYEERRIRAASNNLEGKGCKSLVGGDLYHCALALAEFVDFLFQHILIVRQRLA